MKVNKALRRLTEAETLLSDVVERFSTNAPFVREALQDAVAAIAVAREAVSLVAPSGADSVPSSATLPATPEGKRKKSDSRKPVTKKRTAKKKATAAAAPQTPA